MRAIHTEERNAELNQQCRTSTSYNNYKTKKDLYVAKCRKKHLDFSEVFMGSHISAGLYLLVPRLIEQYQEKLAVPNEPDEHWRNAKRIIIHISCEHTYQSRVFGKRIKQ